MALNTNTQNIQQQSQITIADQEAPIVILFGAPASGKTCILVRLLRYLNQETNFQWEPDATFRSVTIDPIYGTVCEKFKSDVNASTTPVATPPDFYLLAKVRDNYGKTLFQILEAPGELYFPTDDLKNNAQNFNPHSFSYPYAHSIINAPNRKIWCFMVEPNWETPSIRAAYVDRIKAMKMHMSPTDKVILICNKCDEMPALILGKGVPNTSLFQQEMQNQHPGLFTPFINQHPITRLFRKYNCSFVAFSSGTFFNDGTYTQSASAYPKTLLQTLLRAVRGY